MYDGCQPVENLVVHATRLDRSNIPQPAAGRRIRAGIKDNTLRHMVTAPDSEEFRGARHIVERLAQRGYTALLAGGCVRDLLLDEEPKDYDVATDARPETVEALFSSTRAVGKSFGVILVLLDGCDYEVATFRSESGYADGRHPDRVSFTGPEKDAQRRDFTINGMFWNPLEDRVLDFVGGREDLENEIVRTIGDPEDRFREDHLRLIRAVRFASRLGFSLDSETGHAIKRLHELINDVAAERLLEELKIILTDRHPAEALRLMDDLGLLTEIFPEIEDTKGCEQPENYHPEGDVFVHTLLAVDKLGRHPNFELTLGTLLHDVGKPEAARREGPCNFRNHTKIGERMARRVCERLRLSNRQTERVCWLVRWHLYFKDAKNMKDSTLKRLFAKDGFEQLAELHRADSLASWANLELYNYVLQKRDEIPEESIEPPRLVTGDDLIERGYEPGPAFSEILSEVRESQLEGDISTREEALELAESVAERVGAPRQKSGHTS